VEEDTFVTETFFPHPLASDGLVHQSAAPCSSTPAI
jgi:hypothetical protein